MFRFLGALLMCAVSLVFAAQVSSPAAAACAIQISTVQQLQGIGNGPGMPLSGSYCLGKPIHNAGTFNPIGDNNNPFTGQFDGRGYTIDGLTINSTGIYVGLFAYVGDGGSIFNLGLTNVSVMGPKGYDVGALVGRNRGTITNSYTTGSVTGTAGGQFNLVGVAVGGLVGWNFGTITESFSAASVASPTTARVSLGGLSGGTSTGTIQLSYAAGPITSSGGAAGGLVGEMGDSSSAGGTIESSYALGSITTTGSNSATGGLIGVTSNSGTVTQTYAAGPVTGSPTYSGGLVGDFGITPPTISASYWDTYSTHQSYASNGQTPAGTARVTSDLFYKTHLTLRLFRALMRDSISPIYGTSIKA